MTDEGIQKLEHQLLAANAAVANLTAANLILTAQLAAAESRNKKLKRTSRQNESVLRTELSHAQNRRV